jgi:hypothetical protein
MPRKKSEGTVSGSWLLCSHPDSNVRFLVVFKDLRLHSIRDLRQKHISMLRDVKRQVTAFLSDRFSKKSSDYKLFFHYIRIKGLNSSSAYIPPP